MRRRGLPRADEDDWGWDAPFVAVNHAATSDLDLDMFDDDEIEAIRRERKEALARKRPCGFTARWENDAAL